MVVEDLKALYPSLCRDCD